MSNEKTVRDKEIQQIVMHKKALEENQKSLSDAKDAWEVSNKLEGKYKNIALEEERVKPYLDWVNRCQDNIKKNTEALKTLYNKYPEYVDLTANESAMKYKSPQKTSIRIVDDGESKKYHSAVEAYNKKFTEHNKYTPGHSKPKVEGNTTSYEFPTEKEALDFFVDQANDMAKNNQKLVLCDENNNVIAFSNGDGNLYRPSSDGKTAELYDKKTMGLSSAGINIDKFKMSECMPTEDKSIKHN